MKEKDFFELIFLNASSGILVTGEDGTIIMTNPWLDTLLGYKKNELVTKQVSQVFPEFNQSYIFATAEENSRSGINPHFHLNARTKKGEVLFTEFHLNKTSSGSQALWLFHITKKKMSSVSPEFSETRYRSVIEQATDTIYIATATEPFHILDMNPAGCDLLGYSREEAIQLKALDITFEKDLEINPPKIIDLQSGKPIRTERSLKRKDGSAVSVELSAKKMEDGNLLVVARDISERKKAEEALVASEKRFKAMVENNYDVLSLLDESFNVIYRSPSFHRIMGYTEKDTISSVGLGTLHPKDRDYAASIIKKSRDNPGKSYTATFRRQHSDGHYLWMEGSITNFLHDPHLKAFVVNFHDITERKNAEEKLAASEIFFRSIIENSSDIISLLNEKFEVIYRSPSATKVMGWTDEDMKGRKGTSNIHPEDLEYAKGILSEIVANPGKPYHTEFRFLHKNGDFIWVEGIIANYLQNENIRAIIFNYRDVSERKKAEEALQKSEIRFRSLIENNNDMISLMDDKFTIVYRSPSTNRIMGWTNEEMKGMNGTVNIHPEDRDHASAVLNELFANPGKPIDTAFRNLHKNGHYLYVEGTAVNLLDDPNINAIVFNYRDVTQRKKAEDALLKSEARFRTLIENNNDIISLLDDNFKVIYRSPSASRIMGWTNEEIMAQDGTVLVHPDEIEDAKKMVQKILTSPGLPIQTLFRNRHKKGHYVWLEGVVTNLLHDPNVNALVYNYRDVTRRIETEEEIRKLNENLEQKVRERTSELERTIKNLRESEGKFEKVFRANGTGITILRMSDLTYVDVNEAFEKMTGYSPNDVVGKKTSEVNLVVNLKNREEIGEKLRSTWSVKNLEISLLTKSGKIIEVLSAAEIFTWEDERYVLNILYDITERKRMEEQLVAVNKELEAFTYSVSHDLRAPLRAVNGYAQIITEDYGKNLDENGNRILEIIKYNATKMGTLIDDLLTFSRLGRKDIQKSNIDLNVLVEGVMIELNKSVSYKAKIKIGKLHHVYGDYALLNQAVINLIGNAIKYSSHKEKPLVEIRTEQKNGEVVFSVKDNGAGFDMRYVDKLFGVFQRLHSDEEFEGTGVGLAIVHRVITKHGGRVWATGEPEKGALFQFTLPENQIL